MKRITENVKLLKNNRNGNESIWNLKKKVFPSKNKTVPVAKRNLSNQLITNPKELKKVYAKHFQHRMRSIPILEQHKEYDEEVNKKFNAALEISKDVLMPDWKDVDLEKVLKSLKKSQSQDILEMVNELFMPNIIGKDLKDSLLLLFNGIKNNLLIPEFFKKVFITSIPKGKKSPLDLNQQRGIFLVPKLRGIFIKLVYNLIFSTVEENLSSSNIGARKKKAPRDHLFVLYSVMNDIKNNNEEEELDLVFYDVKQA